MFRYGWAALGVGHCFRNAVDLARRVYPEAVVQLEEDWGDWLVSEKKVLLAGHGMTWHGMA